MHERRERDVELGWDNFFKLNPSISSLMSNRDGFTYKAHVTSIRKETRNGEDFVVIEISRLMRKYQSQASRYFVPVSETAITIKITPACKIFDVNGGNFYMTLSKGESVSLFH